MKEIRFVDVGEGITEGHLQKWLVKDGDAVKEDQSLFQIETDKAVVNMPAPISGKVRIFAREDAIVHVGDLIAVVGTDEEIKSAGGPSQPPASQKAAEQQKPPAQKAVQQPKPAAKEIIATPAVRKLARDMGVDLKGIVGTGPEGRILENDIRGVAHEAAIQSKPVPKYSEALEEQHAADIERVPMSYTRKAIAKNMEASWTIPRASSMDLIDATALWGIVQREKPKVEKEFGVKLTFLPYIIKALIAALKQKEFERFNASYDHEKFEIVIKRYYNIGLGAETPDGLKVIVVKDADKKSILQIAQEIQDLSQKLRDNQLGIEQMRDSTFTITNIGSLGGGFLAVPMINYPEVAILGTLKIRDAAVVVDGQVVARKQMPFVLTFDHRVVDGAEAVHFGNALIKYLEDPDFLEMM
ncbi:MAG: 2-oxo acid dehydrogenase subunit E2 [Candidatus Micrarchaeota archaeon]|nr:2-oxo acid dehydrogenase subunit E2 [Candidatus Micrarchaeota archaeon]MDE1846433.1 2-oxo acid dehydrogenase subunit E2 [Candidatus Micrarchaeota archaeon]